MRHELESPLSEASAADSDPDSVPAPPPPPFPVQQLFILAICRICEPIAFMSIFPYVYYMIVSFDITTNDRQIAIYAGMVTSAFAFAEFSTGIAWGRVSDKIGRKPVLIGGLAGTGLSMLVFGFSPNLPVALLARALGGLLNGNIGVLQTTVAEMVKDKTQQRESESAIQEEIYIWLTGFMMSARAYSIMPFVWCLGSILGPALGGALAEPAKSYPNTFAQDSLFGRFPYLLPNLVCAGVLVCGVAIGILFLEETHELKRHRRDRGLETGQWLIARLKSITRLSTTCQTSDGGDTEEIRALLDKDEQLPGYRSSEGSPRPPSYRPKAEEHTAEGDVTSLPPPGEHPDFLKTFNKTVVFIIIGYGCLAFHTIAFDQLMPVLLSTPKSDEPISLPFHFTGGFGLTTKSIGWIMSVQGFYSLFAQALFFAPAAKRFGCLKVFRCVVTIWPVLYFIVPYVVLLPEQLRVYGVYACLFLRTTAQVLSYPANAILLSNSSPSLLVLGTINGVAASAASLSRALGPTTAGFIHSFGIRTGYSGLAWWFFGIVSLLGAFESYYMEDLDPKKKAGTEIGKIPPADVEQASAVSKRSPPTVGKKGVLRTINPEEL